MNLLRINFHNVSGMDKLTDDHWPAGMVNRDPSFKKVERDRTQLMAGDVALVSSAIQEGTDCPI
jgi:hypothetical protein